MNQCHVANPDQVSEAVWSVAAGINDHQTLVWVTFMVIFLVFGIGLAVLAYKSLD